MGLDGSGGDKTWFGDANPDYRAEARNPGKYLPIEILWDPIVKLREWQPWGQSSAYYTTKHYAGVEENNSTDYVMVTAGTEAMRDLLSRSSPNTHGPGEGNAGLFGYEFFIHTVGCSQTDLTPPGVMHVLENYSGGTSQGASQCEEPFRIATNNRNMMVSHIPSTWVGACLVPSTYTLYLARDFTSHFGLQQSIPSTFRFNVVHLDGNVHDDTWKVPTGDATSWLDHQGSADGYGAAYGWSWEADEDSGWRDEPDIDGAFDWNK
ncbi:hypothetical protein ACFL01_01135 [Planctomycetota bacterium]